MLEHPTDLALAAAGTPAGLVVALFMAGLAGGFAHCAAMCGPFVVAQSLARIAGPSLGRLGGDLLAPYHAGRATSYVVLGAVLGAVGGAISSLPGLRVVLAGFLFAAAALFLLQATGKSIGSAGRFGAHLAAWVRPLFDAPTGIRGYLLGVALGFLPCGLLYGALAAAAGTGSVVWGAAAMAGFVLGTLPALLVVQFAGAMAARRWKAATGAIAPLVLLFNSAGLAVIAWRTLN
jgi:sulfite exporter TauE/SafE